MNSKNYHQKKRFGQHWLVNKKILEKIRETAVLNENDFILEIGPGKGCLLYTSPSPRDKRQSRMPSSA